MPPTIREPTITGAIHACAVAGEGVVNAAAPMAAAAPSVTKVLAMSRSSGTQNKAR
jgi:hypothetical protein